jgi:hypothetical protein
VVNPETSSGQGCGRWDEMRPNVSKEAAHHGQNQSSAEGCKIKAINPPKPLF